LGGDGLKLMTKLINNIHETGEWPKYLIEVTMTALKSQKLQNAATIALTAKTVARILRRRIETEIQNVLGVDQFGFRRVT
jgi:hypothetical protein